MNNGNGKNVWQTNTPKPLHHKVRKAPPPTMLAGLRKVAQAGTKKEADK